MIPKPTKKLYQFQNIKMFIKYALAEAKAIKKAKAK